ncbi:M23 family metallopeptidase [Streptomyces griseoviridis]|uniref:M23 family metallopeptidase n=2 Tax=Streptomyces TaxID=1883 RepID=A0A3S9ZDP0_STRGD|nr:MULTISPECIES: M23 family metallopeptidase [Streptomyces]AZS85825.1 M23 family metallopeptidase [Streptomyces griseoviridis]MDT0477349.1 M23 family metallopeptidase [Streptomyces sp. DSM 41014]QCN87317.1 M23 family peptidase [Streptomyces griseoviridis]
MSSRVSSRSARTSTLRARATVLAAGLGVSVALGAGVAVAADTTAVSGTANAVAAQATAQAKAAKATQATAEKKAAQKAAVRKAAAKKAVSWTAPVKKYTLSASFAQAGGMWNSTHSGQDFAVAIGTDVRAAHGGTVVKAGGNGAGDGPAYGNAIVIKHGNGTYSQYAHLSRIDVKVGQVVKTDQHIARSGNTGNSSGPHLHFEIRTTPNYGSAVNPVAFLRTVGVKV